MAGYIGSKTVKLSTTAANVTGNITVGGTVDGRDVAADGVTADAALPKAGGALTGAVTTNSTFDGVDIATRDAVLTATTTTANAALPKAGGAVTGNVTFGDSNKAIFGAYSPLQIYHDGSNSYITEGGTGDLRVQADDLYVFNAAGNSVMISALDDGKVGLGFAGSEKLATTATGIDVIGLVNSDGLTVDGDTITANAQNAVTVEFNNAIGIISADRTGGNYAGLSLRTTEGSAPVERLGIAYNGNVSIYENLGIGTSSPLNKFVVAEATGQHGVEIAPGTTSYIQAYDRATADYGDLVIDAQTLRFGTDNGTERMRIDSSGHLLFAKTSTSSGVAGIRFAGDAPGYAEFTRDGGNPLYLNRETSDGDIIRFAKDGSTVGSIAMEGSGPQLTVISTAEIRLKSPNTTTDVWVRGEIKPWAGGQSDLGDSIYNWKDLHLSGGVYLGGTGSANKLTDFETGSFTATLVGYYSSPTTAVTTTGYYTKVGNTVDIYINFESANTSGASGDMWVTGIPFASSGVYSVLPCEMNAAGTYPNSSPFGLLAGAICYFYKHVSNGNATAVAHNAGTSRTVRVTGNYRVA